MVVLNILFVIFCATSIRGAEETKCDLDDVECTTKASAESYVGFVSGEDGSWEASDPLIKDVIESDTESLYYKYTDAELTGMNECTVELDAMYTDNSTFSYYLSCPELIMHAQYKVNGTMAGVYLEGEGSCKTTRVDYRIHFDGEYEDITSDDGEHHAHITNYVVAFACDNQITYDLDGLMNGDTEKAAVVLDHLNNNWTAVDDEAGYLVMSNFMEVFAKNLNDWLAVVPLSKILNY